MMSSYRGFTLIELIIAIALLGIIATYAALSLHAYAANRNLRAAAREIEADILNCKQRAAAENLIYRMTFTVDSSNPSNYTIERGNAAGDTFTTIHTKSPSSFSSDIRISDANFGGTQVVNFYTRGTVDAGSVTLRNRRNSTVTITVNQTGRTYVQAVTQ